MRPILILLTITLWSNVCLPASGSLQYKYYFRSIEVEDGLSQNTVYAVFQDKQGQMWFGTPDGLNRYDGNNFKIFKEHINDSHSIGNNLVLCFLQDEDASNTIWVGTGNGVYTYNPHNEQFLRLDLKTEDGEAIRGTVRDIKRDKEGNIWVAVIEKGLYKISKDKKLTFYSLGISKRTQKIINSRRLAIDDNNNVWIATQEEGLLRLSAETEKIDQYLIDANIANLGCNDIYDLYLLNSETLLLGTSGRGVLRFNLLNHSITPLLEKGIDNKYLFVRTILRTKKGDLWIGTERGLYIYNLQTKQAECIQHVFNDPFTISDNAIHSLYQDSGDGIWIGTFFGGVNYFTDSYSQFKKYYPVMGANSISGKSISEFCEDTKNNIWIGTEDAGLNCFNPATHTFTTHYLPTTNIHALMHDEETNSLWVGTFSDGLYILNLKNNTHRHYQYSPNQKSLNNNSIYSIYKDYHGTIWVGTMTGLHTYDSENDNFERIKGQQINKQVNDIIEDYNGILWFGTIGNGIFTYDRSNDQWQHYPSVLNDENVVGKMISCLLEDKDNRIWVGTDGGGLYLYDRVSNSFECYLTSENGLPNDVIYQLEYDITGNIWGSTNKGLFKFEVVSNKITTYTHANGLLGDQFNYKSGMRSKAGRMYFGGIKGFVSYLPYDIDADKQVPTMIFNSFQINNKEVIIAEKGSPLSCAIAYASEVNIPYNTSIFSIEYTALNYASPKGNSYAYMLEGRDKEWIYTNNRRRITFSELPPGNYQLRVKTSNSDGVWGGDGISLKVNILPPFYLTVWAYIIYALVICGIVYSIIWYNVRRANLKNKRAILALEREKEKELYNAKIDFFTNVTHEIRTPLSLIKSPLEEVMQNIEKTDKNWENLSIMQRNANRLLKLVNELLDFRNTEFKSVKLNFVLADILQVIKDTRVRFQPSAKSKEIEFDIIVPQDPFYAHIDIEIITKMLSNLFNNALKHANKYMLVEFGSADGWMQITVANDGERIPTNFTSKIFDPFFKLDEKVQGSGIGLPFARSLATLHHGLLFLDEENSKHTVFVIKLPIHQETFTTFNEDAIEIMADQEQDIDTMLSADSKQKILFVEDNDDFMKFAVRQLSVHYTVLTAKNGQEALNILSKESVFLIITDIMMPIMDGMTFCSIVKSDLKYSHIPIIMLTAKTSIQSKMDGLKIGADEYIEKPYSIDYLMVRINNLLENREKIRKSYKDSPELTFDIIAHSKADEEFLNKLIGVIHEYIDDVSLSVDVLAEEMNMSRATFYRKVKSISELTPNDFIRLIRLKKAAELLKAKEYRVNEIAFIVGFNSSSYFSKCFYKQFGVLPKDVL